MYLYDQPEGTKVTANGMARALASAGFEQVYNGAPLLTEELEQARFFAVRNPDKWLGIKDRKTLAKNIALPPLKV
jgi:hypothetical protein